MQTNYSGQEMTADTVRFWLEEFSVIARENGIAVLRESLMRHIRSSRFLPTISDVHDRVKETLAKRRGEREQNETQAMLRQQERWKEEFYAQPEEERVTFAQLVQQRLEKRGVSVAVLGDVEKVKPVPPHTQRQRCASCEAYERMSVEEFAKLVRLREMRKVSA